MLNILKKKLIFALLFASSISSLKSMEECMLIGYPFDDFEFVKEDQTEENIKPQAKPQVIKTQSNFAKINNAVKNVIKSKLFKASVIIGAGILYHKFYGKYPQKLVDFCNSLEFRLASKLGYVKASVLAGALATAEEYKNMAEKYKSIANQSLGAAKLANALTETSIIIGNKAVEHSKSAHLDNSIPTATIEDLDKIQIPNWED